MTRETVIVPGITLSASGQAHVDPVLTEALMDLAVELEQPTGKPVDVEHVVAAIVLAAAKGEISSDQTISATDPELLKTLATHVTNVFKQFGGTVGDDD